MRGKIHTKLRSRSGETLAEVLVALLIIGLSSALLLVMVNTAAAIDRHTRAQDEAFYAKLTAVETHASPAPAGSIVTIEDVTAGEGEDNSSLPVSVTVYGGDGLTSYEKAGGD